MIGIRRILILFLCLSLCPWQTWGARATPGVYPEKVVFGQSAAFKGPAAALGNGMRDGILAAFRRANETGGIHNRRLDLITYDDGYEPDKAIRNVKRLIDNDHVFALIGEVGTPTAKAVQPIATRAGVPFIGPLTGAEFLRNPYKPKVVNVRASYYQETDAMVEHLVNELGHTRIAILYQDDSYGRAGLSGVKRALKKRDLKLVSKGTYKRNTIAVKTAVLSVRKGKPQAIIIIGAYKPAAEFIRVARKVRMNPLFLNVSFVGSKALAKDLGEAGQGVIVTQVVPFPEDTTIPLVAEYRRDLRATNPDAEFGFVSLEGYIVGRLVLATLNKVGPDVTRQRFLDTLIQTGRIDLGGIELTFGPNDNQGMDKVFFTRMQPDGSYKALNRATP